MDLALYHQTRPPETQVEPAQDCSRWHWLWTWVLCRGHAVWWWWC